MKEAIQLIADLNEEFYEITKTTEWTPFAFDTDGTEWRIIFLGFPIFSSVVDGYIEEETGKTLKDVIMVYAVLMINDLHQFDKQRDRTYSKGSFIVEDESKRLLDKNKNP